jgi:hypothetical protein
MAAKKKPVVKPPKPAPAPKAKKVAVKAAAPTPPKSPEAPKAGNSPESAAVKAKDSKDKKDKKGKKKDKKMHDGDNAAGKSKMVRDSFTMPAPDYALIGVLKTRTLGMGAAVKKSELLRAGLVALAAMSPAHLVDLISAMPEVKTGRPGSKKK